MTWLASLGWCQIEQSHESDRWCLRMTTLDELPIPASTSKEWINLRNALGKIQGRYNRRTKVLIIVERKVETEYQLAKFDSACVAHESVIG